MKTLVTAAKETVGRSNVIRKITISENISCLLDLALSLHYTCLV